MDAMRILDLDKLYFTSDLHFCHNNIVNICKRPFSILEQNETLIRNWNNVVPEDGTVFILGDVVFAGSEKWNSIIPRLNGTKYLILGNHDHKYITERCKGLFANVVEQMQLKVGPPDNEVLLYLNHYPMISWEHAYKDNSFQLHGHVHSKNNMCNAVEDWVNKCFTWKHFDVGVDNNNYEPVSFTRVMEIIQKQKTVGHNIKALT